MADAYHWYVRNTFVEVVPASVLTPSIDNPGVRRSSSAPPIEVRLLRLGLMVDTASSSVSIHVPDPSTSPAPSTSLVRLPLADRDWDREAGLAVNSISGAESVASVKSFQ